MCQISPRRILTLRTLYEAHDEEQYDRPNGGNDNATDETTAKRHAKGTEQEAAEECTNDANDEIAEEPETTPFDKYTRKPTGYKTNDDKPDNAHFIPPVIAINEYWMDDLASA
jgi:hypothetical protein